jgi:hypothetical protein
LDFSCDNLDYCVIREGAKEMSIQSQPSNSDEITIIKYFGLQNVVSYDKEGYQGDVHLLYSNNTSEFKQIDSEVSVSAPSFKIIDKKPGMFLYELPGYKISTLSPFYVKSSISSLKSIGYEKLGSINVINPQKDEDIDYVGVLYEGDEYRMFCKTFFENVNDVPEYFGSRKVDSLHLFKRDKNYLKDLKIRLTLYNNVSCSEGGVISNPAAAGKLKKCEIIFSGADEEIPTASDYDSSNCENGNCTFSAKAMETIIDPLLISKACPNLKNEVYSFRIDSPSAIIFMDSRNNCDTWDNMRIGRGQGVCNTVNSSGFNPSSSFIPNRLTIVPYNE